MQSLTKAGTGSDKNNLPHVRRRISYVRQQEEHNSQFLWEDTDQRLFQTCRERRKTDSWKAWIHDQNDHRHHPTKHNRQPDSTKQ